jgi:hypothetical protein
LRRITNGHSLNYAKEWHGDTSLGLGDELIISGQAKQVALRTSRRVRIVDIQGRTRYHDLWRNNPRIAPHMWQEPTVTIKNGPGCRAYIDYTRSTGQRWAWKNYDAPVGELFNVKPDVRAIGKVIIDPTIKEQASPNKQWHGWQAMVDASPQVPWMQIGQLDQPTLRGVERLVTPTFWNAINAIAAADAAVVHEGFLHHAAAAVGKPAVVLFGGFISPKQTGYATHRNIFTGGQPCGFRTPCDHCRQSMNLITPDLVLSELEAICAPVTI